MSVPIASNGPKAHEIPVPVKAEVLLEALPYIQRFRGSTFVIKYGGSFMDDPDPEVRTRVATDLVFLAAVGIQVVVVHGGGKAISRAMTAAGIEPVFNRGHRVTDAATVRIVERTLNDEINPEIVEIVQAKLGRPLGMTGNTIFICTKRTVDDEGQEVDLGYVGDIQFVKTKLIKKALAEGYMPIVSPVAEDATGQAHNTNADIAAAHIAASLRARRLIYLSDVPGLLRDPKDPASLISTVRSNEVPQLISDGVISSGMLPKMHSAVRALQNGVNRVHFIDGRMSHSLLLEIFTHKGIGTEILAH